MQAENSPFSKKKSPYFFRYFTVEIAVQIIFNVQKISFSETFVIAGAFEALGHRIVQSAEKADLCKPSIDSNASKISIKQKPCSW